MSRRMELDDEIIDARIWLKQAENNVARINLRITALEDERNALSEPQGEEEA